MHKGVCASVTGTVAGRLVAGDPESPGGALFH